MSNLDTMTEEDVLSMGQKNRLLLGLCELYNAMIEVSLERPVDTSFEFCKAEAKRRINLGIVRHSYLEAMQDIEVEQLDG